MEQSSKPKAEKQMFRERRVFLFEQLMIFSEEIANRRNNMSSPGYIYKHSIKVRCSAVHESVCPVLRFWARHSIEGMLREHSSTVCKIRVR